MDGEIIGRIDLLVALNHCSGLWLHLKRVPSRPQYKGIQPMHVQQLFTLPSGTFLPSPAEYASILRHSVGADNATINEMGMHTSGEEDDMVAVRLSDVSFRFMPGPEFSIHLYRGQNQVFPTCKPSLWRRQLHYGHYMYWQLKTYELMVSLEQHPALHAMARWRIGKLGFQIDPQSIAQHYGYQTDLLDLTRSRNMAMFFATHKQTPNGRWVAVIGNRAQLFTLKIMPLIEKGILPLGIDPFCRPFVQRAFALRVNMHDDLLNYPEVSSEEFTVTKELAEQAWQAVGGPQGVYPPEPLEGFISQLRDCKTLSQEGVGLARYFGQLPDGMTDDYLERHLGEAGYLLTHDPVPQPSKNLINKAEKKWLELEATYMNKMKFRLFAPHIRYCGPT